MVTFRNGDMYHEVEISIDQDEVIDGLPLKAVVEYWGVDEVLEYIGKDEIVEYLSKNGYQIAEEQ